MNIKNKIVFTLFTASTLAFTSCNCTKNKTTDQGENQVTMQQTITITGEIITVENGKDGYMATIKTAENKEYTATISVVNLQKNGGVFKRYEVGDTVTVTGTYWSTDEGKEYITATAIK